MKQPPPELKLAHSRGDVYRALIEGIAYATRHILETYEEAGAALGAIRAVGGGLRKMGASIVSIGFSPRYIAVCDLPTIWMLPTGKSKPSMPK